MKLEILIYQSFPFGNNIRCTKTGIINICTDFKDTSVKNIDQGKDFVLVIVYTFIV